MQYQKAIILLLIGIGALTHQIQAKSEMNLLEQKLKELRLRDYHPEQYFPHPLRAEGPCNSSDKNSTTGEPTTNRCLGVPCKRDDLCQDNYCVTNPQSKQLPPTFLCGNSSYRPPCNYSKNFNEFNESGNLNIVWSTQICGDVECDWDADCAYNLACSNPLYQQFPVCNGYRPDCNISTKFVVSKNYTSLTDNLVYTDSVNRCNNTNCTKTSECNSTCWDARSCGGPECNFTADYKFWNENSGQIDNTSSTDLCGGFQCQNDDICKYGCANATSCFHYFTYCNSSYMVQVYNETSQTKVLVPSQDRCEFVPCMSFDQCFDGNDCYNGTCLNQYNFCNRTAAYQSFNDTDGKWTVKASENRCLGTQCFDSVQCAFDHQKKLGCNNATCSSQNCNSSYIYQFYIDSTETVLNKTKAINRCPGSACSSDDICQSNSCYNSSCLSTFQSKPSCNASYAYENFIEADQTTITLSAKNRCFEIQCAASSSCNSGKCYNGSCLSTNQPLPSCNATAIYQEFNETRRANEIFVSVNRCNNIKCESNKECQSGYCCTGKDCNSKEGPVCIVNPGNNPGKSNSTVTILAIIGGVLLIALIVLGIFFYRRKSQMDDLRRELARSQAGNSVVVTDQQNLLGAN